MYNDYFGLREQPFGLTPNTAFFLSAQGHREALNMMQVALAGGEGFIKVVGEVGTGKTLLCRKLLAMLGENYYTAYIPNPLLTPGALYRALAQELGVKSKSRDGINEFQVAINGRLIELVAAGQQVVLVVDEAQAMSEKSLEALRLISNLETETRKLIHIVLFGQPELDRLLANNNLRQLRQRITFSCQLPALNRETTRDYISHRLSTAGYNGGQLFSDRALSRVHKVSGGVPRLLNILCHKAMLSAYGKGARQVDASHIALAVKDTEGLAVTPWYRQPRAQLLLLFLLALLAATLGYVGGVDEFS